MAKDNYVDASDLGKSAQLTNFATKLPAYLTLLSLLPADGTAATNDAAMFAYILQMQEATKTFREDVTRYKNALRDGLKGTPLGPLPVFPTLPVAPTAVNANVLQRFRKLCERIKSGPAYTPAIGEDLGIIGNEQTFDPLTLKPVINVMLDAGRPLIKWQKGHSDGIDIYVDRGEGFVFLATDTQPDYLDTFPLPDGTSSAMWTYKAIYRLGDSPVGQYSNLATIAVAK